MKLNHSVFWNSLTLISMAAAATSCGPSDNMPFGEDTSHAQANYEVWLLDQSNTNGTTFGGTLYIYDGRKVAAGDAVTPTSVNLGGATSALCLSQTGANPVRPHMIFFNAARTHGIISFVASGHVAILDAATKSPVACFRMTPNAGGLRQAHAAFPSADDSMLVVANQNGKILERINTNYATNTYVHDTAANIDLANCVTPNGVPCQLAGVRPDNAPICPIVSSGGLAFITLRGGGMFVVDPTTTPMSIVGEYTSSVVHGNGCGGLELGGSMFINSGGATAANLTEFDTYRFPLSGYAASNAPDSPAPIVVFSDDAATFDRDSHGMTRAGASSGYLWALDRAANLIEVFKVSDNSHANTITVSHPDAADPTPDLGDISPDGKGVFVSLRGPNPLSGDPHVATGSSPGLGFIQVGAQGASGTLNRVLRVTNIDAGGVERADAHGIRIRLTGN